MDGWTYGAMSFWNFADAAVLNWSTLTFRARARSKLHFQPVVSRR